MIECLPSADGESSCLCLPCQFFFVCYIWILNSQIKIFPSRGPSDWLISWTKVFWVCCLMSGFSFVPPFCSVTWSQCELHSLPDPLSCHSAPAALPQSFSICTFTPSPSLPIVRVLACWHYLSFCKCGCFQLSTKPLKTCWGDASFHTGFTLTSSSVLSLPVTFNLNQTLS